MKNKIFLLLFLLCLGTASFAQRLSVVEPELQQLLDGCDDENIAVTIVMKSQMQPSAIRAKVAKSRGKMMKREVVVKELKTYSDNSQESLLSFLQSEEKKGNVSDISSLWISNSIVCRANRDIIVEIANRADVTMIGLNKEVQMLCNTVENDMPQTVATTSSNSPYPHVSQVNAPQVWEQGYTGKNVVVAILDSGINDEHCDLKDHLWQGYADADGDGEADDLIHGWNYTTKDARGNANIKDDYGHGTHCAGIICGDGTMGNIAGVAPDATLMTLKVVNRSGGGSPTQMIKGVQFAVENGASILSISSGFKSNQIDKAAKENLRRAFEATLESGVIAFVAAGNDGNSFGAPDNVDFPAACPPPYLHPDQKTNVGGLSSVVCVGAVNANDEYASFSSQGPVTWQGTIYNDYLYDDTHIGLIRPDICAPGDWIYSLKHDDNDKYKINSGTSQATPCVAGVAALMLEKNSTLTPADICSIMENTAKKLSETKNNLTGSGRVDALKAVEAVEFSNAKPYIKVDSFTPDFVANGSGRDISLDIVNNGHSASSVDTYIRLLTNDKSVAVSDDAILLGSLLPGEQKDVVFSVDIAPEVANGHTVYMKAVITDGEYSWIDDVVFRVKSYAKIIGSLNASDVVVPGECVSLDVDVVNEGNIATVGETYLALESSSPYVTFVRKDTVVDIIVPGEKKSVTFLFNVSEDAPDGKNLQFDLYAVPNNYACTEDLIYGFELHIDPYGYLEDGFEGWTTFDASNDGRKHPWWHSSLSVKHRMENCGTDFSGEGHLISESYCLASMMEYSIPIDNYLVSPRIKATINSKFAFKARVHSSSYYGEHFGIAVSESVNNDATSFKTIKEWTINSDNGCDWLEFSVDLSEYAGKEIYVAIRHFFTAEQWEALYNGYDVYALHVDDARFSDVIDMSTTFKYDNYSYFSVKVAHDKENMSIVPADDENLFIQLCNGAIVVSGVVTGDVVSVYDVGGRCCARFVVENGSSICFDADICGNGIFLVKVVRADRVIVRRVALR